MLKTIGKVILWILLVKIVLFSAFVLWSGITGTLFVNLDMTKRAIIQYPVIGVVKPCMTQGTWLGFGGHVWHYPRTHQYWASADAGEGTERDESIPIAFNDQGTGRISLSMMFHFPDDEKEFVDLHRDYGSSENVIKSLFKPLVEKSVNVTGNLMSSRESAVERRSLLYWYIEDQITNGIYETEVVERQVRDSSGTEVKKMVTALIVLRKDKNGKDVYKRQGDAGSSLTAYGISISNFSPKHIEYSAEVKKQLADQQQAEMAIITSAINAKVAEQKRQTVKLEGEANVMHSKYEAESANQAAIANAKRDKEVAETLAAQRLTVAKIELDASVLDKQRQFNAGDGEAYKKRAVFQADGGFAERLGVTERVQKAYAAEIGKQTWTPKIVVGGNGSADTGLGLVGKVAGMFAAKCATELESLLKESVESASSPSLSLPPLPATTHAATNTAPKVLEHVGK